MSQLSKEITLELVRVTEAAALMASKYLGRGDKEMVDKLASDAMRGMLDYIDMQGVVIIGEGEKDKAPMLYIGEQVGNWEPNTPELDIAVDPIDGTRLVAYGLPNAISVIAATDRGAIEYLPTFYSYKLAVGPELAGKLDINASIRENLRVAAAILNIDISELTVVILNRDRHREIIEEVRKVGARIKLISDGDIAAAIATALPESYVDIYIGIGGSPEATLAAAALKSLGGEIQIKLWPIDEKERNDLIEKGYDLEKVYKTDDLIKSDNVIFAATGVTDGDLLRGVKYSKNIAITESLVMRSKTKTLRKIISHHNLKYKTIPLKSEGEVRFINGKKGND
ncbi:fructose 1,6-bisphosphatase II [Thermosipho africanus H17ap60334]|jgi:fructose-1,6-bisphosphatase II|uniref:Fructose-1,6-bisphosphatase n=1 Tax=Thermosipho africanus (strain TCF52B) TaxID=484019 RepID=B7IHL2_THEAB|nr:MULTISPECIES: class II fructose-bisphosphatase [Thermosipho]ACJ75576.1 fructose-1,6-bisphosphatase, class II [Thermosipho africanus TCF52B]EKF49933.1 fructose 1,6-bisphosphatase II [Thermosipho africanus H17ap60334]MBZ4651156.1 glpX [Thermosipho sp. (in: thermotogales)]MDK2840075.1 fructose,6-bisphosphatase [Thermosipho sp. (in: thermotogales)]MDK2900290.1 fructose,6-bisphosphatase [Thermosipho sp. (in: thermotogales)]